MQHIFKTGTTMSLLAATFYDCTQLIEVNNSSVEVKTSIPRDQSYVLKATGYLRSISLVDHLFLQSKLHPLIKFLVQLLP